MTAKEVSLMALALGAVLAFTPGMRKAALAMAAIGTLLYFCGCAATPSPTVGRANELYHSLGTTVTETHRVVRNPDGTTNLVEDATTKTYNSPLATAIRDAAGIAKKGLAP